MPVKVVIVTKVAGCRPLTLMILTLSQICFKNPAKITTLCFKEWVINVPFRSVLLILPVLKRYKLQILFCSKKCRVKEVVDLFCQ